MAGSVKLERRRYDSPRRREQAASTRRTVLDAAHELFIDRGYAATTMDAVADRAGVSSETVYAVFGTKRALLSCVFDAGIVGDGEPVPLLERRWVQDMREEPDPRRRMRILARNGRMILERVTPIYDVVCEASGSYPEIDEIRRRYLAHRHLGQTELVRIVVPGGALRRGVTIETAADVVFAIGSPETYRLLTVERAWSPERFERWYAATLASVLLR